VVDKGGSIQRDLRLGTAIIPELAQTKGDKQPTAGQIKQHMQSGGHPSIGHLWLAKQSGGLVT